MHAMETDLERIGRFAPALLILALVAGTALTGAGFPPTASCYPNPIDTSRMTLMGEAAHPAIIEAGKIPVGESWTYIYQLKAGRPYHIYLTGPWANPVSHKTDYDVHVYEVSSGAPRLVSSHTQAAGIPEQVWNDEAKQFFTPTKTGNYYICVVNDERESSAAEAATLMVIEKIGTNRWYTKRMEGKSGAEPSEETDWAAEFNASAQRIMVFVDVPDELDMYEVRLYAMANPTAKVGGLMNGVPIAWEPGLRGLRTGAYGGFNFDPWGYRNPLAMASCEYRGQDMVIDYSAPAKANVLYHLVLIAEYYTGYVEFIVQTDFESPALELLDPPGIVESGEPTPLRVRATDDSGLRTISLSYSADGGETWKGASVEGLGNSSYEGVIPAQEGGAVVEYSFEAVDVVDNGDEVRSSFKAMTTPELTLNLDDIGIVGGDSITSYGYLKPGGRDVTITYSCKGKSYVFASRAERSGYYSHTFKPDAEGKWSVSAGFPGDDSCHPAQSDILGFVVVSLSTNITCVPSRSEVGMGHLIKISGSLDLNVKGVEVDLLFFPPGNFTRIPITTSDEGEYSLSLYPPIEGVWEVQAMVEGDGLRYRGSESPIARFRVVDRRLTTLVRRLPTTLTRPPYIYGLVMALGGAAGGFALYWRRRG